MNRKNSYSIHLITTIVLSIMVFSSLTGHNNSWISNDVQNIFIDSLLFLRKIYIQSEFYVFSFSQFLNKKFVIELNF